MSWLSENPWPLGGPLIAVALGLLIVLKVTQQGKYLVWAGAAAALAAVIFLVEWFWLTDRERIEAVVHDLGRAVARSDTDAVLDHMTPDVSLTQNDMVIGGPGTAAIGNFVPGAAPGAMNPARMAIRATIESARFDFLTISRLKTQAGRQSRMGQAEFRVHASGSFGSFNFATPTSGTDWSLGFREEDGAWKVQSITPTRLPRGYSIPLNAPPGR